MRVGWGSGQARLRGQIRVAHQARTAAGSLSVPAAKSACQPRTAALSPPLATKRRRHTLYGTCSGSVLKARYGSAAQGRAGQGRAAQGRAGQRRAAQGRAGRGTDLDVHRG